MEHIRVEKAPSKGIVMGKAYLLKKQELDLDKTPLHPDAVAAEMECFDAAVAAVVAELRVLAETSDIFAAHLDVARDAVLRDSVEMRVTGEMTPGPLALQQSIDEIVAMFAMMDDEYLKERATDIQDVGKRILHKLLGVEDTSLGAITQPSIVIADDLAPSDTAQLNPQVVRGFITKLGGATGHVVIMARSMEIPAAVGVGDTVDGIRHGDDLILDAISGIIVVNPDIQTLQEYQAKIALYLQKKADLANMHNLAAVTSDGHQIALFANVGGESDVQFALSKGAEGIGLFRSEFLYMQNTKFPTEEEQFNAYKNAIQTMRHPTIIRTLDIGGDKELSYYSFDHEENPFLGWRAIRISLDLKDVFKTQLRAILRASAYGDVKIMYPMIISVEEFLEANEVLAECKAELRAGNIPFNPGIETGVMIETPAAVLMAHELAKVADFFSIGTNDLTQYLLAVDRGNQKIARLYNSFHPAVLNAIKTIIEAGHKAGIEVGMCGEFASDPKALPILLGLGLDEFSMSASEIPATKYQLRDLSYTQCQAYAQEICALPTLRQVLEAIGE